MRTGGIEVRKYENKWKGHGECWYKLVQIISNAYEAGINKIQLLTLGYSDRGEMTAFEKKTARLGFSTKPDRRP